MISDLSKASKFYFYTILKSTSSKRTRTTRATTLCLWRVLLNDFPNCILCVLPYNIVRIVSQSICICVAVQHKIYYSIVGIKITKKTIATAIKLNISFDINKCKIMSLGQLYNRLRWSSQVNLKATKMKTVSRTVSSELVLS